MSSLTWQQLHDLNEYYGDSFYLIDLQRFQSNYRNFLDAFSCIYANTQIAYSYKTNYIPRLCRMVQEIGGYAEVVSGMEYELALRIGVPPTRIIFNGPYKQLKDFNRALLDDSIVNLDSAYEVDWVCDLAERHPEHSFRVGIRCNLSFDQDQPSRFGFDIKQHDFEITLKRLRKLKNCLIVGLHCHVLARDRSADIYRQVAERMLDIATTQFSGQELQFIDLGGGFFSPMKSELQKQFPYPIPSFTEYGTAVAKVFDQAFPKGGPELILEPGISITADIMQFATKVIDLKTIDNQRFALVAGSRYDIKPTLTSRNLPLTVYSDHNPASLSGEFEIVGSSCMEGDTLFSGFQGQIKVGDYLVFDNTGAYTNVLRPPFINPASAIIALSDNHEIEVIRRQENLDDVFASYKFS